MHPETFFQLFGARKTTKDFCGVSGFGWWVGVATLIGLQKLWLFFVDMFFGPPSKLAQAINRCIKRRENLRNTTFPSFPPTHFDGPDWENHLTPIILVRKTNNLQTNLGKSSPPSFEQLVGWTLVSLGLHGPTSSNSQSMIFFRKLNFKTISVINKKYLCYTENQVVIYMYKQIYYQHIIQ